MGFRFVVSLLLLLAHGGRAYALDDRTYFGHLYTFEKAETHTSILGGRVYLLQPGGNDVLHDTSWALLIEGSISTETTRNVQNLLQRTPGIRIIYFNSPGGDLFAGLSLGRLISRGNYQVVVNADAECASACALAFLGGKSRMVIAPPERFGFHRQYYIRDGEIRYGSWSTDVATISEYLKAIGFTGLPADEIVGTTGLATYSDRRLADRGIITVTRSDHRRRVRSILESTGATAAEQYMASCFVQIAKGFACANMLVPFRLPLIVSYLLEEPDQVLNIKALQQLQPVFAAVRTNQDISEVNCKIRREEYIEELMARYRFFLSNSPPAFIVETYKESVDKEIDSCVNLLRRLGPR